jgi:hypothetical protein
MAASGVSKCGAPEEEHTSFTGTVLAVPGVLGNRHGTVVDVVDVADVALVAAGGGATATVEEDVRWRHPD